MLETVSATADTGHHDDPYLWLNSYALVPNLWRRIGGSGFRLHDDATGLASLTVRRASYGPGAGQLQVVAEANLTALAYGKAAKVAGLPTYALAPTLQLAVDEAVKQLPGLAPHTLAAWMPSRVDASATWFVQGVDHAVLWGHLEGAARSLDGAFSGRGKYAQPGTRSLRIHRTKEHFLRIYDKTTETIETGSPLPESLSPARGRLLRIEAQHSGRTARQTYGKTLADLAGDGTRVATNVLQDWIDHLGTAATATGYREVLSRLRNGGLSGARAASLVGPAMILRAGGIDALVRECEVSRRTAYAWAAEIRSAVPDEDWSEVFGVPLDLADVLTADRIA